MYRIGQSAVLVSSLRYGKEKDAHSETERGLVINDSLTNLRWLKIQSGHLGNLVDTNLRYFLYFSRKLDG
jgi:hypothetical protein